MNNIPLGWSCLQFKYAFKAVPFTTKIKQKEYALTGQYPIIDQGEYFIGGYSDNNYGLITDIPVIAFGDHTRRFKYIDFPFIPGADGLKIYKPIYSETKFSFYQCLTLEFPNRGYARHNAFLQKCLFYLPPLEEQGRIVEKIEELFSDIDNGIKDLKTAQAQIKQYRQSVLKYAFEGKLYKTSEWKEVKLNSISMKIGSGATPKGGKHSYYKAGIPIIRSMNVLMNHFSSIGLAYLNDEQAEQLKNVITEKDDVLLNITGASIGRTCVLPDYYVNARVNQHVAIIRTTNKIVSKFLSFYLSTPYMQNKINNENYGVTRQALTKSTIENFDIPLPSLPEQQQIVAEIEKRFLVADELEKAVNEGLEKADKLKQSILKKAFEGKLVPQDPNDEPASALLDRIKKEQKPTKGKKK